MSPMQMMNWLPAESGFPNRRICMRATAAEMPGGAKDGKGECKDAERGARKRKVRLRVIL